MDKPRDAPKMNWTFPFPEILPKDMSINKEYRLGRDEPYIVLRLFRSPDGWLLIHRYDEMSHTKEEYEKLVNELMKHAE